MATLQERHDAKSRAGLRNRTKVALVKVLTDILREVDNPTDDTETRKRRRAKQIWANRAIRDIDGNTTRVLDMITAAGSDNQIDTGLDDDAVISTLVGLAVDAISAVELEWASVTLPP